MKYDTIYVTRDMEKDKMSFGRTVLAMLRCRKCGKPLGEVRNCDLDKLRVDCQDCSETDH